MGIVSPLPERVEGPKLLLRRWTIEDLSEMTALISRNVEHLRPWMPWVANEPLQREERRDLLERWEREWREGGDLVLAIVLGGRLVGGTGLHRRSGPRGLEIGYWVDKDHLGQGIASEAAKMLTSAALSLPAVSFVEIHHDKANVRSAKIPARLSYSLVGESKDVASAPAEIGIDCTWRMTEDVWHSS